MRDKNCATFWEKMDKGGQSVGISDMSDIPLKDYYSDKTPLPIGSCPLLWPQLEYSKEQYEEIVGQHNVMWVEQLKHYILHSKYSEHFGMKWYSDGNTTQRFRTNFLDESYENPTSFRRLIIESLTCPITILKKSIKWN